MAASHRKSEDEETKYTAAKAGNKLTIKKGKRNITTRTNKAGQKVRVVTRDTKDGGSKFVKKTVRGTTGSGGKVVKRKNASGTVTTRTNKAKGRSSTRTSDSKGRVTGITKQKGGVKEEYGSNSVRVKAANRIKNARKKLRAGEEVKGRAGRIAKLQAQRRADRAAGKNTKATSKKIRQTKARMRNRMSSKKK